MKFFYLVLSLLLVFAPFRSLHSKNTFSEYWQELTISMWKSGPYQLFTYARYETANHWHDIRSYHLSEQFSYQVCDDLSLWANYRYVHSRNIVPDSRWRWQHRLELEANPVFHPFLDVALKTRNRLEIRKLENTPEIRYRIRQRTMFTFPIKNVEWLKEFSVSNEIFYDLTLPHHRFRQDRFCPAMFTFPICDKVDLDVFLFIRFFINQDIWRRSYVVGSNIRF